MRVSVYFNLHRKCYSVRAEEGPEKGRVVAHADRVGIRSVTMHVGKAGNRKVRETGKKNVHATMRGMLDYLDGELTEAGERWADVLPDAEAVKLFSYDTNRFDRSIRHATEHGVRLSYDPYRDDSFVVPDMSRLPVREAWVVTLTEAGTYGVGVTA